MATRLTGFSKLVITLLILAALFFGGRYVLQNTKMGQDIKKQAEQAATEQGDKSNSGSTPSSTSGPRDPNTLRVQLYLGEGMHQGCILMKEFWLMNNPDSLKNTDLKLILNSKMICLMP